MARAKKGSSDIVTEEGFRIAAFWAKYPQIAKAYFAGEEPVIPPEAGEEALRVLPIRRAGPGVYVWDEDGGMSYFPSRKVTGG